MPPPPPQVIRANETMFKAGQMERVILRKLGEADPESKRHCIRMLGSFEYRNHLCLVFESMVRVWVWAGGRVGGWVPVGGAPAWGSSCWALGAAACLLPAFPHPPCLLSSLLLPSPPPLSLYRRT